MEFRFCWQRPARARPSISGGPPTGLIASADRVPPNHARPPIAAMLRADINNPIKIGRGPDRGVRRRHGVPIRQSSPSSARQISRWIGARRNERAARGLSGSRGSPSWPRDYCAHRRNHDGVALSRRGPLRHSVTGSSHSVTGLSQIVWIRNWRCPSGQRNYLSDFSAIATVSFTILRRTSTFLIFAKACSISTA